MRYIGNPERVDHHPRPIEHTDRCDTVLACLNMSRILERLFTLEAKTLQLCSVYVSKLLAVGVKSTVSLVARYLMAACLRRKAL